jgi:hypothetical protein
MLGAAATVAVLLGASAAAGGTATAATNGVGTTTAKTTVLNVALGSGGSLLNLNVLGDNGTANIDPKAGTPSSAGSTISPLTSTSSVSALNLSLPKIGVSSTGAADNKTVPSVSLATPLSTGSISPLSLSAVVDAAQGAASGLNSSLNNVTAVGGLLSVPSATSSLGAAAKPGDADGLRGLSIPSIQVLNLGAVLQGLGINPASLQLGQVGNALTALGVTVPNGSAPNLTGAQLVTTVNGITSALTSIPPAGVSGVPGATLISALPAPLQTLLAGLFPGGTIPVGVTDVNGLVAALNAQVTSLLTGALSGISNAPLLQVKNLVVGISTKAADTVQNSAADIKASLGSVQVGNLNVPGVDLASLLTNAQNQVNGVLNTVGLGNLITVKALDQTRSVATSNGYVNALANLTGVHVAIAPLSSLAGGTAAAGATDTMGQLLGSGNVPALSTAMATLNTLLPTSVVGALTQGATVDVLSVGASSAFVPAGTPANPSAPTPQNGTLAVTGGPTQVLGFIGLLLLATVAGLRWLRRPATTH